MDYQELLTEWRDRTTHAHRAHRMAAAQFEFRYRVLGAGAVSLSAIVGTTIFFTLQESPDLYIRVVAGLLSIVAAVLAALQTFMDTKRVRRSTRDLQPSTET